MTIVYKTFVRSKIEYGSLVYWRQLMGTSEILMRSSAVLSSFFGSRNKLLYPRLKVGDRLLQWASRVQTA